MGWTTSTARSETGARDGRGTRRCAVMPSGPGRSSGPSALAACLGDFGRSGRSDPVVRGAAVLTFPVRIGGAVPTRDRLPLPVAAAWAGGQVVGRADLQLVPALGAAVGARRGVASCRCWLSHADP